MENQALPTSRQLYEYSFQEIEAIDLKYTYL